jgi:ATP-dependent RNA helicase DeaD
MTTPTDLALPPDEAVLDFADLPLPAPLHQAVAGLGFAAPTAIQAGAIPALLAGRDLVGVAQTGTGKTAAFGLPLLAAVDPDLKAVQAIVLTPTRELALQVADALASFATHLAGVAVVAVYGGAPYLPQQRALAAGAQVVVGTPGRVIDHLERGTLVLDRVRAVVLDEADEMLQMGFAEDVDRVLDAVPAGRQVALFSATMPAGIRRVAEQHLVDPVHVAVARPASTVSTVRQTYAVVPHRHKIGALVRVLATSDAEGAIVFVRTRQDAERVGSELVARGVSAAYLSGDVAQGEREKIVDRLRSGALRVLVATDVAARGLDVDRVGLVVNLDVPRGAEPYVHRIGRTGRAGRAGEAMTFVTPAELPRLAQIERTTRVAIEQVPVPTPAQVSAHRVAALLARADERAAAGRLDVYRAAVAGHLAQRPGTDVAELLAVVAALAVGDEGPAPRPEQGDDLDDALARLGDAPRRTRRSDGPRDRRRPEDAGSRYRVAVGHRDGLQPGALVGALTGEGGLTGKDVGKIDIFGSFSLVEIPGGLPPAAVERLSRTRVAGRPLHIRPDTGPRQPRDARDAGPHRAHDADRPHQHRAEADVPRTRHRAPRY